MRDVVEKYDPLVKMTAVTFDGYLAFRTVKFRSNQVHFWNRIKYRNATVTAAV